MPRFRVRVFIQCAPPGVTPDQQNALVTLPRRMLFELPRELAPLLERAGEVTLDEGELPEPELALLAARKLIPRTHALEVLPMAYAHREVDGAYVASTRGSYTFIVGRRGAASPTPMVTTSTHLLAPESDSAADEPRAVEVEFRCHVVVDAV